MFSPYFNHLGIVCVFIALILEFWILNSDEQLHVVTSITCSFGWKPTKLHTFWGSISSAIFMIDLVLVHFSALLRRNGLLFRYPGFPFLLYVLTTETQWAWKYNFVCSGVQYVDVIFMMLCIFSFIFLIVHLVCLIAQLLFAVKQSHENGVCHGENINRDRQVIFHPLLFSSYLSLKENDNWQIMWYQVTHHLQEISSVKMFLWPLGIGST